MSGHRTLLDQNVIENNGLAGEVAGIRIQGETKEIVLKNNLIRDTRPAEQRNQIIGIQIEEKAGPITIQDNSIEARIPIRDGRKGVVEK
jgi:hypothetical protein